MKMILPMFTGVPTSIAHVEASDEGEPLVDNHTFFVVGPHEHATLAVEPGVAVEPLRVTNDTDVLVETPKSSAGAFRAQFHRRLEFVVNEDEDVHSTMLFAGQIIEFR